MEETIKLHEERCRLARGRDPLRRPRCQVTAIPFPDQTIPDETLARMQEVLDTEPDCDLSQLATRFSLPASLIARELPYYRARYRRWIQSELAV